MIIIIFHRDPEFRDGVANVESYISTIWCIALPDAILLHSKAMDVIAGFLGLDIRLTALTGMALTSTFLCIFPNIINYNYMPLNTFFFRCCKMHDWCYDSANCPMFLEYFVPYLWKCYRHRPLCGKLYSKASNISSPFS